MKLKRDHVMQFKVTLKDIKPPIWRRIQVPCDYSFWDLHVAIQDAMGWYDGHLHEFQLNIPITKQTLYIGIPDPDEFEEDANLLPGWEVPIAAFFGLMNRKADYLYDFGDGWDHLVVLEKILPIERSMELPACTGGRRNCPPEDCGGPVGYEELLEIMAHPEQEGYEEMVRWLGKPYDPDAFKKDDVLFSDPLKRLKTSIFNEPV